MVEALALGNRGRGGAMLMKQVCIGKVCVRAPALRVAAGGGWRCWQGALCGAQTITHDRGHLVYGGKNFDLSGGLLPRV